jgi:hypothetical protein
MNQEQWRAKRGIWAALPSPSDNDNRGETRRHVDANGPATSVRAISSPSLFHPLPKGCGEWFFPFDRRSRHV